MTDNCLPISSYEVRKYIEEELIITDILPSKVSWRDTDVGETGTTVTYQIRAVNKRGPSIWSEPLFVKVGTVPVPPTDLKVVEFVNTETVKMEWTPSEQILNNPAVTSYRVYLDKLDGNPADLVYDTGKRALSTIVTINGLELGKEYGISVAAVN